MYKIVLLALALVACASAQDFEVRAYDVATGADISLCSIPAAQYQAGQSHWTLGFTTLGQGDAWISPVAGVSLQTVGTAAVMVPNTCQKTGTVPIGCLGTGSRPCSLGCGTYSFEVRAFDSATGLDQSVCTVAIDQYNDGDNAHFTLGYVDVPNGEWAAPDPNVEINTVNTATTIVPSTCQKTGTTPIGCVGTGSRPCSMGCGTYSFEVRAFNNATGYDETLCTIPIDIYDGEDQVYTLGYVDQPEGEWLEEGPEDVEIDTINVEAVLVPNTCQKAGAYPVGCLNTGARPCSMGCSNPGCTTSKYNAEAKVGEAKFELKPRDECVPEASFFEVRVQYGKQDWKAFNIPIPANKNGEEMIISVGYTDKDYNWVIAQPANTQLYTIGTQATLSPTTCQRAGTSPVGCYGTGTKPCSLGC